MNSQSNLFEEQKTPNAGTLNYIVLKIMMDGKWRLPWEVCTIILQDYKIRVSDSSCTARIRELRSAKCGGHTIEKRKVQDSNAYEYRLVREGL